MLSRMKIGVLVRRLHSSSRPTARRAWPLVAREADGWTAYGGMTVRGLDRDAYWRLVREQAVALDAQCERHGRDPRTLSRSVLVGYAAYHPIESVELFLEELGRAGEAGFDEVVVYWPSGKAGTAFWADPAVAEAALGAALAAPQRS